jgi:hypothetical protein
MNPDATVVALDALAERIRAALRLEREATRNALRIALDIGDDLNKARERVSSGWISWLNGCGLTVRTAQLRMQLAEHRAEIEARIDEVGELSLRAARRLIATPKDRPKAKAKSKSDLQVAWDAATDAEKAGLLRHVGLGELLRILPDGLLQELDRRLSGQVLGRLRATYPNKRLKDIEPTDAKVITFPAPPTAH